MNLDLTEAVEAAGRAYFDSCLRGDSNPKPTWEGLDDLDKLYFRQHALMMVAAAAPLIAAQAVRALFDDPHLETKLAAVICPAADVSDRRPVHELAFHGPCEDRARRAVAFLRGESS